MCACAGSSHSVNPARSRRAPVSVYVRLLLLSLCALLVQGPCPASCIPVSEFFPFGTSVNDSMTAPDDDGGSGKINLTVLFPFFGNRHDRLYVNNNGVISFFKELRDYRPENFPLEEETPIIAPYWADVDISKSNGHVWYRETREASILNKATNEIRAFGAYRNFRAYWVFVATWDEVGFYGATAEGLSKKNTFQAVLVLDATGRQSFVILNYAKIEWTTGSNSEGDPNTGLGGSPAQAGFNAGDKVNYFEIEGARTNAIINLTQTSNMGVPGKWIFRIDSAAIVDVCSQEDMGSISFDPMYSSMLGGERLFVGGLCSQDSDSVITGRIPETGQDVCCTIVGDEPACFLPPIFRTGPVNITLNLDNQPRNYSGTVDIKNIMDVKSEVRRHKPEEWKTGRIVEISWRHNIDYMNYTDFMIEVLEFRIEDSVPKLYSLYRKPVAKNVSRGQNQRYQLELPSGDLFSGVTVAVVRVTPQSPLCNNMTGDSYAGPAIYSDVFPVIYDNPSKSEGVCRDWLSTQSRMPPLSLTGHCPCILRQAEGDTARYMTDPFCNEESGWSANCLYRPSTAGECIMPNRNSAASSNYVCCYDRDTHELLHAEDLGGGGTQERYSFRQGPTADQPSIVPYFTYMQEEIAPYLHCYKYSTNDSLLEEFLKIHQPVGCQGYEPPSAAQAAGDPHIETLDHVSYTFNGKGEFVLLRVRDTETEVQVRATPALDPDNQPQNATVFSGIALKASNSSSTLEIGLGSGDEGRPFSVYVDSQEYTLSTSTSQLTGMTVYKNQTLNGTVELTVVMEDVGLSVLVEVRDELLNIMVMASAELKGRLEGLLGNYNGKKEDDLEARDGTRLDINASMRDVHFIFGMSWNVSSNDSLFTETSAREFDRSAGPELQTGHYTPTFSDEMSELRNNSAEVCGDNKLCMFDWSVTGNEKLAKSTKDFSDRYEARKQDVDKVIRCPYLSPSAIENGSRNLTGLKEGDKIIVECHSSFQLNGSGELKCTANGEWNSAVPSCTKVDTSSRFNEILIFIGVGGAAGGFLLLVVVVIVSKLLYKRHTHKKIMTTEDQGSEFEECWELPTLFPPSDIPTPVFENPLFMSSLSKLSEKGSFRIPRPTFVDPNIYSEYF